MMRWIAPAGSAAASIAILLSIVACTHLQEARAQGEMTNQAIIPSVPQEETMESPKRKVPTVPAVVRGGIRYEVLRGARSRGFAQNGGVIAAIDVASGKELWTLLVYQTSYDPHEEKDVQDRFITAMTISKDGAHLLIRSENKKSYRVDIADRTVTTEP